MPRKRGEPLETRQEGRDQRRALGQGWLGAAKRGHTGAGAAEGPPPRWTEGRQRPARPRAPWVTATLVLTPAPQLPFRGDEEAVAAHDRNHRTSGPPTGTHTCGAPTGSGQGCGEGAGRKGRWPDPDASGRGRAGLGPRRPQSPGLGRPRGRCCGLAGSACPRVPGWGRPAAAPAAPGPSPGLGGLARRPPRSLPASRPRFCCASPASRPAFPTCCSRRGPSQPHFALY